MSAISDVQSPMMFSQGVVRNESLSSDSRLKRAIDALDEIGQLSRGAIRNQTRPVVQNKRKLLIEKQEKKPKVRKVFYQNIQLPLEDLFARSPEILEIQEKIHMIENWNELEKLNIKLRGYLKKAVESASLMATLGAVLYKQFPSAMEAEKCLRKSLTLEPKNPFAMRYLGAVVMDRSLWLTDKVAKKKKLEEAKELLQNSLKQEPKNAFSMSHLATVKALESEADSLQKMVEIDKLFIESYHLCPEYAFTMREYARFLIYKSQFLEEMDQILHLRKAYSFLMKSLKFKPNDFFLHSLLGDYFLQIGIRFLGSLFGGQNLDEAEKYFRYSLSLNSQYYPAASKLGYTLLKQVACSQISILKKIEKLEEAIALARKHLQSAPQNTFALSVLGMSLLEQSKFYLELIDSTTLQEAEDCLKKVIGLDRSELLRAPLERVLGFRKAIENISSYKSEKSLPDEVLESITPPPQE